MAKKGKSPIDNKIEKLLGGPVSDKVNCGLYIDRNLKEVIDSAAKSHGTTFNGLVVKILEEFFKEKP